MSLIKIYVQVNDIRGRPLKFKTVGNRTARYTASLFENCNNNTLRHGLRSPGVKETKNMFANKYC